jgi:hypothetical protein
VARVLLGWMMVTVGKALETIGAAVGVAMLEDLLVTLTGASDAAAEDDATLDDTAAAGVETASTTALEEGLTAALEEGLTAATDEAGLAAADEAGFAAPLPAAGEPEILPKVRSCGSTEVPDAMSAGPGMGYESMLV